MSEITTSENVVWAGFVVAGGFITCDIVCFILKIVVCGNNRDELVVFVEAAKEVGILWVMFLFKVGYVDITESDEFTMTVAFFGAGDECGGVINKGTHCLFVSVVGLIVVDAEHMCVCGWSESKYERLYSTLCKWCMCGMEVRLEFGAD